MLRDPWDVPGAVSEIGVLDDSIEVFVTTMSGVVLTGDCNGSGSVKIQEP